MVRARVARTAENLGATMYDVFICESSSDEPLARSLLQDLKAKGLNPFLAGLSLTPGENWSREIHVLEVIGDGERLTARSRTGGTSEVAGRRASGSREW